MRGILAEARISFLTPLSLLLNLFGRGGVNNTVLCSKMQPLIFSYEIAGKICAKTLSFLVQSLQILAIANTY
jgi:hypothetical protein